MQPNPELLKRLTGMFLVEAREHVESLGTGLLELEKAATREVQLPLVETLFRAAHSLKGAARAVNAGQIERTCHRLEDVFSELKSGKRELAAPVLDGLHKDVADLGKLIEAVEAAPTAVTVSGSQSPPAAAPSPATPASAPAPTSAPISNRQSAIGNQQSEIPPLPAAVRNEDPARSAISEPDAVLVQAEELLGVKRAQAEPAATTAPILHPPADFGSSPPDDSRGASLLIVDDSPTQAEQLRAVLEMHGYQVAVARNGAEALVALRQSPPQLVLSDIVIPEMDGYELCRRIKAEASFQNLPVILLTSLADSQDVLAGLACGADCFITKPFNEDYLIAKLPQLLGRRDSGRDDAPRVAVEIRLGDQTQVIQATPQQMLTLLLSTYEAAVAKNGELTRAQDELRVLNEHLEFLVAERTAALSAEAAERQRAHEALQQSEQNFRGSLERSLDGIIVVDAAGGIVFANPAAAKVFGRAPAQLLGSPFAYRIVPGQNMELEITSAPGKTVVVEMRMAPTEWHGQPAFLVSLRDVTHRKRNEQQLRIAGEELKRLNKSLVARNTEIQKFYHTLSHELKTPLTSAREFISILLDGLGGPLNETQLEYLKVAMESCDQLRLFVNDLLDVTRLETGKMSLNSAPGPLAATVTTVVKMLSPAATGKSVRLTADCQPSLPDIPFDKHRIMQVLTNLITNAIKFTPAGGEIQVRLGEAPADPKSLQVAVCDTGRGIPADQLGLIFNRLHQAHREDASAESRSGLGLGLYICQELVQLHGGRIWAESQLGQGSTFSFTIPKRQATLSQTLLVVDDEAPIRSILRFVFEKAGYKVVLASGGAEALALMRQQLPALVILDLLMPDMNGAETLLQIREEWQALPVILHTAYLEGDLMNQALKGAPFTVVAKPALPEQFLKTIRDLLGPNPGTVRRPPAQPTSEISTHQILSKTKETTPNV